MMKMLSRLPALTPALIVAGVALRVTGLMASAIWFDEAWTLAAARLSWLQMLRATTQDFNPPLWVILEWVCVHIGRPSLLTLRLPALAASIAGLLIGWKIARHYLTPGQEIAAVCGLALMPYQLWMSQDGRQYGLLSMLFLLGWWLVLQRRYWWLALTAALLMWTHTTGLVFAGCLYCLALLQRRQDWKMVILSGAAALAAWLPWLPSMIRILGNTGHWVYKYPTSHLPIEFVYIFFIGTIKQTDWQLLTIGIVWASVILAALFSLGPMLRILSAPVRTTLGIVTIGALHLNRLAPALADAPPDETDKHLPALALIAAGPPLVMLAVSLLFRNILFYRTLSPALAPCLIWFAAALTPRRLTVVSWILPYTWAVVLAAALVCWSPSTRGAGLDLAAANIAAQWQEGDLIYHSIQTTKMPFDYYLDKPSYLLAYGTDGEYQIAPAGDLYAVGYARLEDTPPHKRTWLIWAREPLLSADADKLMRDYTAGATLIQTITYWQAAPIEIYLREEP